MVDQMCVRYNVARSISSGPLTFFSDIINSWGVNAIVFFSFKSSKWQLNRRNFLRSLALDKIKLHICSRIQFESIQGQNKVYFYSRYGGSKSKKQCSSSKKAENLIGHCYSCPWKQGKRTRNCCSRYDEWVCKDHQKKLAVVCIN